MLHTEGANMEYRHTSAIAQCIGCGCHDLRACEGGCSWLRVDYRARVGVCSQCRPHLARWDTGDRAAAQSEPCANHSEVVDTVAVAMPEQGGAKETGPLCHFTPMSWESADNGYAGVDYWWECRHRNHRGVRAAATMASKREPTIPRPQERVPASMYADLRAWLLANDPDAPEILAWSNNELPPPATSEKMAAEIIWIILCAGRSAQAARTIERKVWDAIHSGRPVIEAFGYRAKAAAIERAWREREQDFAALQAVLKKGAGKHLVEWCGSLPFVGEDTQFQLAKNFGADVCKPDIWLCRLTGIPDRPRRAVRFRFPACMALCRALSEASGDRVAAVDSMLWLACNKAVLVVDADAGPVRFSPKEIKARSIYQAAAEN
jgi:hypothetical protein